MVKVHRYATTKYDIAICKYVKQAPLLIINPLMSESSMFFIREGLDSDGNTIVVVAWLPEGIE